MGGWRGSPLRAPQPPRPPQLRCQMKRQLYPPGLEPPRGRRCRSPASQGTAQTCLPEKQGKAEGSTVYPSPLTPLWAAGATLPHPAPPFPHPGKPGPRGQTGRFRSGSRNSPAPCPAPPFQGLLWPSAPAERQPEWLPSLPGPCQAGGRDAGGVTRGWPEGASPSAMPGIGFCRGTAAFWGAPRPVRCQVYFVPAAVH